MLKRILAIALTAAVLSACSAGPGAQSIPHLATPSSTSPGAIAPAPMAKTAIQPSNAMSSRKPASAITGLNWGQISGSATAVAAATDGSIWALSDLPSGADKYIWHYSGGTWTNIPGLASEIAVAPNGTLYAVNSGGGTYAYAGGTWTSLGGGAVAITAVADNSIYVLSNGGGPDHAIWHNVGGTWSQVPGSGVALYGSIDPGTYAVGGGTISAGGLYILNSSGAIYYMNASGGFVRLPGNASSLASTTHGGTFALGYPADPNGEALYYYDLQNPGWTVPGGSGVSLSSNANSLYVVAASGGIFTTPVTPTATPTPTPSPSPTATPAYACDNNGFLSDQTNYVNGSLTVSYIEVDVCGAVTQVLPAKKTSSGNHGYFYVTVPGTPGTIEIVSNLDAMAKGSNPPPPLASWPWVAVGDYVYVQGRYYYDTPHPGGTQGIDWTEGDTGSWPTEGWVVVNGTFYN